MKIFKSIFKIFTNKFNRNLFSYSIKETNKLIGPKLHIGPGPINLEGWINLEARKMDHIHIVSNSIKLEEFTDNSIAEIYMCHVLEHFSKDEVNEILSIYFKKLKLGGALRISVPSFDLLIDAYLKSNSNITLITPSILGGHDYEYNIHKIIFNKNLLTKLLTEAGFSNIIEWNTKDDFGKEINDWSSNEIRDGLNFYKVSLNLKCKK